MMAARILGPVCFVLLGVSSSLASRPAAGLIERVLANTCVLWLAALAIALIVNSGPGHRKKSLDNLQR